MTDMTKKQKGWSDALEIVLDWFNYISWQKGLDQERKRVATNMQKQLGDQSQNGSQDYRQAMTHILTPFCKMLKGQSYSPSFSVKLCEMESVGRNDALEIVLYAFKEFAYREEIDRDRSCSEIADDMCKRVQYEFQQQISQSSSWVESQENLQDYRDAMASVVKPFYKMLKKEPLREPLFNT